MSPTSQPAPLPPVSPVPTQLVQAIATFPQHCALSDPKLRLSYSQLGDFTRACQPLFQGHQAIGIYGAPSALMGAASTACVIDGRPFVHLDPAMPNAVLSNIVAELEIGLILTCQTPKDGQLPDGPQVVDAHTCLRGDAPRAPQPLRAAQVDPQDSIYLVATSGTTGRPKCIPVPHDAARLSYDWRDAYTPYDPGTKVGIYIFAIWEMFRPLRKGAECCFPGRNQLMSPKGLVDFLRQRNIYEMLFTPSFYEKILQAMDQTTGGDLPLRRVVLNGEVVSDRLISEAREKMPRAVLWNLYSICETHDISMSRLQDIPSAPTAGVAVGRCMPHIEAVVLDDNDQPCPPGGVGLLHFQGPRMLGPGYVNRPEETARRFRTLMINGQEQRLYDTGDQGYVDAEGQIFVLGRVAHMLKLRGHSIQTHELTQTLGDLIGFSHAIPWVRQVGDQGQALVFYYTADDVQRAENTRIWGLGPAQQRTPKPLVQALRQGLPEYCIPSYLVQLDEIPINQVSGKCDFKRLPEITPIAAENTDAAADTAPALPVVQIAARVMGCARDSVDPQLSFHDQGGDSLMAVDLLLSLEQAYGRHVDFDWALNLPLTRLHELLSQDALASPARPLDLDRAGILLTGATGFLGGHVMAAAISHLPADQVIYCLVRPRNNDPQVRLQTAARAHDIPQDRIVLVEGSLDDPKLGLDAATYQALCAQTHSVVHCAAMVNLAVDRTHMESWSHTGIANILEFCRDAQADLRFSSSNAVHPDTGGPHGETPPQPYPGLSGYGAAKIAAEAEITASGVAASIVRLPSLYDLDNPNPKDIYETILGACAQARAVPDGLAFHMIDVRQAARMLVAQPGTAPATLFNLIPNKLIDRSALPDGMKSLPMAAWLQRAPLPVAERQLIADTPTILCADAVYENDNAAAAWQRITNNALAMISDPQTLLSTRFARQPEQA